MVIMALDYGDRYVGVAISDNEGKIALRYSVVDINEQDLFVEIGNVIEEKGVERIVVGMPKGLSGNETLQTKKTREFIEVLRSEIGNAISVDVGDEAFTSLEARRIIKEEGGNKGDEHTEAARLILENFIHLQGS